MSGPQFIHIQTWSGKPNPAGQSINSVIEEANRVPEFSTHVADPKPPIVLLGNPSKFRQDHDDHVAARTTMVRKADGTSGRRSIRKDRHTMASIVISYPKPYSDITTDEERQKLEVWKVANMNWLRGKYKGQLRVLLLHEDETYPHLHAWLLPDDPSADAKTLHPGKMAKRQVEREAKHNGVPSREAVKLGNRALKEAMTSFQDEYYGAVGFPMGLTRTGPKRRRLTRQQWVTEKADAVANAAALAALQDEQRALEHRSGVVEEGEMFLDNQLEGLARRLHDVERREGDALGAEEYIAAKLEEIEMRESAAEAQLAASLLHEKQAAAYLEEASKILVQIEIKRREIEQKEQKLERLLSGTTKLINRVGGIVRSWVDDLGLTVSKHEKLVEQIWLDLRAIEEDNLARIASERSTVFDHSGTQPQALSG